MKKLAVFLAIAAILILSACGDEQQKTKVPDFLSAPYTFTADFTMENLAGQLVFIRYGPEEIALEFLAPETLAGMTINVQSGEVAVDYRGILYSNMLDHLERTHPVAALYKVLSGFQTPLKTAVDQTSGHRTFVYEAGIIIASDTAIISIQAPDYGLTLAVTAFRLL